MKTIYIKVEVPDDWKMKPMYYPAYNEGSKKWERKRVEVTEITLPSEDEIMKKYPFNNEAAEVNAYRREGATWLLNKMKGE